MQRSGIYKIVSAKFPDREYIGSATRLDIRKRRHFYELRRGTHFNRRLQNHFNKYGEEDLSFMILEIVPRPLLLQYEQIYIDRRKPYFNINPIAGSHLGSKHDPGTVVKKQSLFRLNWHPFKAWRFR